MMRASFKGALLLVGMLVLLSACKPEPQGQPPSAPPVSVAEVIYQTITEWDEFTGRLQAPESVELRPRVAGYIEQILFEEGALVEAGTPLVTIDSRSFKAEVSRLQASLANARSQLALAESEYQRAKALSAKKAISDEVVDNRLAQLRRASAELKSVNAALDVANLNLDFATVKAPIDGRVSNARVTKGNYVAAGDTLLTSIVSTDKIYAYFDADEATYLKYIKQVQAGSRPSADEVKNPVYMALAGENDFPHQGHIDFVDNQVNPSTGTIRGRAVFDNEDGVFLPGLFARLRVIGSASYEAILIDDKAVGTDLSKKFVLLLDENNVAQYREVVLGETVGGLRIVHSGLKSGDKIVVNGLQRVRPGSPVMPEEVKMASEEVLQKLQAVQQRVDKVVNQQQVSNRAAEPASDNVTGG